MQLLAPSTLMPSNHGYMSQDLSYKILPFPGGAILTSPKPIRKSPARPTAPGPGGRTYTANSAPPRTQGNISTLLLTWGGFHQHCVFLIHHKTYQVGFYYYNLPFIELRWVCILVKSTPVDKELE